MKNLASYIDHTALKPETTETDILKLCEEAKKHQFFSVCVNPCFVALCANELKNSNVSVCTVIGFPLGAQTSEVKTFETIDALKNGAQEIDMVINVGALKNRNLEYVQQDISSVVKAANGRTVKVIIEVALLTEEEKILACTLSSQAGAHFVKTCTGFSGGSATVYDVQLMKKHINSNMKVKASGGIKDSEAALQLIKAGADRLGASAGVAIINNLAKNLGSSDSDY